MLPPDVMPAELLWVMRERRFTGRCRFATGGSSGASRDRVLLSAGSVVAADREGVAGREGLSERLVARGGVDPTEVTAFAGISGDGVELGRRLVERGLLRPEALIAAAADYGRRRLFALASARAPRIEIEAGFDALAHFVPAALDPRPAVAFGFVQGGDPAGALARRVCGRRAHLLEAYDASENPFGFPPAILRALDRLRPPGLVLGSSLAGLGLPPETAAGLLRLLEVTGLLGVRDAPPARSASQERTAPGLSPGALRSARP